MSDFRPGTTPGFLFLNHCGMQTSKPLITIPEARKLLGPDAKTMSDSEIVAMVASIGVLAEQAFQIKTVRKTGMVK